MKKLKEFFNKIIPPLWGVCWVIIITVGSVGLVVILFKWLLNLLGVL